MFGCEGAAFANIVFMPTNSIIAPVSDEKERFLFHSPLVNYIQHRFSPILLDSYGNSLQKDDDLLSIFEKI